MIDSNLSFTIKINATKQNKSFQHIKIAPFAKEKSEKKEKEKLKHPSEMHSKQFILKKTSTGAQRRRRAHHSVH